MAFVRRDQPQYHVRGKAGWLNDPNGPMFYNGVYHMFFQHLPTGCAWNWNLVWGHAVSTDLVNWRHLPPAIVPTSGSYDGDGCFSGCATLNHDGTPVILYTGVRLKSTEGCVLPPVECDLQLPFIETQCAAVPTDLSDPFLTEWTKVEVPWLSLPPPNRNLGGWRDPYVLDAGLMAADGTPNERLCLMGSGIKEVGGNVIVYRSTEQDVLKGWEITDELCTGYGQGEKTGYVWECPILCKLSPTPAGSAAAAFERAAAFTAPTVTSADSVSPHALVASTSDPVPTHHHFLCISPDACTKPSLYWLGNYKRGKFDLPNSLGPFKLDLGDILYAPNTLIDPQGRTLLWAWQQERRKVGTYDYAGCLSLPRVLTVDSSRGTPMLVQTPLPEAAAMRRQLAHWHYVGNEAPFQSQQRPDGAGGATSLPSTPEPLVLKDGWQLEVPDVSGPFLEVVVKLQPGQASDIVEEAKPSAAAIAAAALAAGASQAAAAAAATGRLSPTGISSGLLLRAWQSGSEGSAAVLYHWDSGVLEVVFEALDPETLQFSLTAPGAMRVGGPLKRPPAPGEPLELRIFIDYSLVEIFTSQGEVLSTRVYRGEAPEGSAGVELVSFGGETIVSRASAYEMSPIWDLDAEAADEETAAALANAVVDEQLLRAELNAAMNSAPSFSAVTSGSAVLGADSEPLPLALAGALAFAPDLAELLAPELSRALLPQVQQWQQWQHLLADMPAMDPVIEAAIARSQRTSRMGSHASSRVTSRRTSMVGEDLGVPVVAY